MREGIVKIIREFSVLIIWIVISTVAIVATSILNKPNMLVLQDHDVNGSLVIVRWIKNGEAHELPVFSREEANRVHSYLKKISK